MKRGRKPLPKGSARVPFNARVSPETKRAIEQRAGKRGVGRLLDLVFAPETMRKD